MLQKTVLFTEYLTVIKVITVIMWRNFKESHLLLLINMIKFSRCDYSSSVSHNGRILHNDTTISNNEI
jgi:hypothetical protein